MITDQELFPQGLSQLAPQFLVVCGTITDDLPGTYYFASGSEIIFLDNNSGLEISSNSTVDFRNAYIHGCTKLWDRIRVKGNAQLWLTGGCRVEDAKVAIHLEPNSYLYSVSNQFDGNVTSIYAGEIGTPNQYPITCVIGNTIFSGQKQLIENFVPDPAHPSCFLTTPVFGISVQDVQQMTIGTVSGSPNSFQDFSDSYNCFSLLIVPAGIYAQNSNLIVQNSRFENIAYGMGGRGVRFAVTPGSISSLDFTGLGKTGLSTFENVETGIYGLGNMNIRSSLFNNLERGIYLGGVMGPYTVRINDNTFQRIAAHSVEADQISPINRIEAISNEFNDNDTFSENTGCSFLRSGIRIFSFTPGTQNSWIYDNDFVNSPKTGTFHFGNRGVAIQNLDGALIEQNIFLDNYTAATCAYQGISLFKGSGQILGNVFTGSGNYSYASTAMHVNDSPSCWLNCNTTNQTAVGLEYKGMNSDGAEVEVNNFNTHQTSLKLLFDAVIGPQENLQNQWIGNSSTTEALFEGRNPFDVGDQLFISQSRFLIHAPNMTTDFWPDPRLIGATTDPNFWFKPGDPSNVECVLASLTNNDVQSREISRPAKITEADLQVMTGTYIPVKGYPAGLWEAELRLFSRLNKYPELKPVGSLEDAWYSAVQYTSISGLGTIYEGILKLSRYSEQEQDELDAVVETFQAAADALAAQDDEFVHVLDNPNLFDQLFTERKVLETTLAAAMIDYQNLFESALDARRNSAQLLLDQLASIYAEEVYELDFKTVCHILLETYLDGSVLSTENRQSLESIAVQCRYSGGMAVLQARAALPDNQDYTLYDSCPEYSRRYVSNKVQNNTSRLLPNPANGNTTLQLDQTVESGRAILRNVNGRMLREWSLDGLRQLDLRWSSDLPPGLYFLEVLSEQTEPEVLRLTINK